MDYDLVVIGAGSGGIRAARTAADLGARVAVVEHGPLGGTCVNVGCVPKKLFVYAAHFAERLRDAAGYGWQIGNFRFDWPVLLANKNREIERLNGLYQKLLDEAGIHLYRSRARIAGAHEVRIDGTRRLRGRHILVATGSEPTRPAIPGAEFGIVSDDAFFLDSLPRRVLVVGGGYIGVEFSGIYHGLGVETLLIHRGDLFLRGFDDDCRRFLADQLRAKGIQLRFNCELEGIEKTADGLRARLSDGTTVTVDTVLFATGRRPRTADLGLKQAGVALTAQGAVQVNDGYTSTVPSIHAVGDVIDRVMLTPAALAEGTLLARRLFDGGAPALDYEGIPTCIFSQPALASVGLSDARARAQGRAVRVYRRSFRPLQHSLSGNPERNLVKLVVDDASDRVLGAFMVGEETGEILQGLAVAMTAGATKAQFDATLGIHPTAAEEFVTLREAENREK